MPYFESLKEFVKVHFNIHIHDLITVNIIRDNSSLPPVEYNQSKRSLSLNLVRIPQETREQMGRLFPDTVEREGILFLDDKSRDRIEDIELTEHTGGEESLLSFFKDKIPYNDFTALRASLYLRRRFGEKADKVVIEKLKSDIIQRYSRRGRNICDLCSAGYFETLIKPLYEELSKYPDFSPTRFLEAYNLIVEEGTLTVFVSGSQSVDQVSREIGSKIKRNRQYGIHFLYIHGIGRTNIETIRMALLELKERFPDVKRSITESANIISVKLIL